MQKEKIIELFANLLSDDKESCKKITHSDEDNGKIKIIVLQRGWVQIGRLYRDGMDCRLENCYIIRKWGTEKGLGELASEGKQSETILDKCSVSNFDYLTVCFTLDCCEEKWENVL